MNNKNGIEIYETDTTFSVKGYCVTSERWAELKGAASYNRKQPLSYAIHTALSAVESAARKLIAAQGVDNQKYVGCTVIDDGSIAAAIESAETAFTARAAKISNAAPTYACAGRPNGCPARVSAPNTFCASCAHDEE